MRGRMLAFGITSLKMSPSYADVITHWISSLSQVWTGRACPHKVRGVSSMVSRPISISDTIANKYPNDELQLTISKRTLDLHYTSHRVERNSNENISRRL